MEPETFTIFALYKVWLIGRLDAGGKGSNLLDRVSSKQLVYRITKETLTLTFLPCFLGGGALESTTGCEALYGGGAFNIASY